jgi:hypothetical protein
MRKVLVVLVLLFVSLPAFSKVPTDAWQTGTLADSSESSHTRGGGAITGNQYGVHGAMGTHEYPIVQYIIETDAYIYQANLVLHNDREKRPSLTIHGPIKFAILKSNFYIQDEQGKEYKLVLDKKTLKTP